MIELGDIRSRVVTLLQDNEFTRWSKTELNNYIHDALLDLVRTIRLPSVNNSVIINDSSYLLSLPLSMMDVNGGSIEGRELPVVTTSEMKSLAHQGRLPVLLKQGEYSVTQIFGNPLWNPIEDWTTTTGTPQSIVLDQKSSSTIRIWPIPTEEATIVLTGTLRPFRMSDQVPYTFLDDSDDDQPLSRTIATPMNGWNTGDTLVFASLGYKTIEYIIPDSLQDQQYSLIQIMARDTFLIPTTVIDIWPSYEQFKQAFVNKDIPNSELERAEKNLSKDVLHQQAMNLNLGLILYRFLRCL